MNMVLLISRLCSCASKLDRLMLMGHLTTIDWRYLIF